MLSYVRLLLKEHFTPKKKSVVVSSPPCWGRVGGSFVVCKTFLELHSENRTWNGFELPVQCRLDLWKQQEFKWIWKDASYTFSTQSCAWCVVWWLSCKTTESLHPDDFFSAVFWHIWLESYHFLLPYTSILLHFGDKYCTFFLHCIYLSSYWL